MSITTYLNPILVSRLHYHFGDDAVRVNNEGQPISWTIQRHWITGQLCRSILHYGETYVLNCPFCSDCRQRLWICHRWGLWDQEVRGRNLGLIKCFNEDCFSEKSARREFFLTLSVRDGRGRRAVVDHVPSAVRPLELEEMAPPGELVRLDALHTQNQEHFALEYLRGRGFDPHLLGKQYGVSYCAESRYRLAEDRIIIPIFVNGVMVGWQARHIGDPDFKSLRVPKYWSCPGMQRSRMAYNFDKAITYPTVVLVEGPSDVWGFGPQAMALLGKAMSSDLRRDLVREARKRKFSVVILLDPDQSPQERAKGRLHHIEKLYNQLSRSPALRKRLVKVYLPKGCDPGSMVKERKAMRSLILREARKASVAVSFKRSTTAK